MPIVAPSIRLQPVATQDREKAWLSEQGRAHSKAVEMAAKVRDAHLSGKRMQPVMRDYLRNPQVRLSGALKALGGSPSQDEAMALRDRVSAWTDGYVPVRWRVQKKSGGGERYICTLPPELKAVHYILKRPLEQLLDRKPNVFGVKFFSRDDLAEEIKSLQNAGYVHIATTDVIDCYQSVDPDAVYELPLPKEVIRRTLDTRNLEWEYSNRAIAGLGPGIGSALYGNMDKANGPKGLMQGSPVSGVVLAWLLNGIPSSENARVFLCFDNLIVLAKKPSETRAMVDTLAAHFERCSSGPFALCDPEYADNEPAEFLGYLFDPKRHDIGIGENGQSKLFKRLNIAEGEQEALFERVWTEHQKLASNPIIRSQNPFINHYPTKVWEVLLSFRAGFSKVQSSAPELSSYLENSRWLAERTDNGRVMSLHDNLFADADTEEARTIRSILKTFHDRTERRAQ